MEKFNKNKKPDAVQLDINFEEESKDKKAENIKENFHGEIEEEYLKEQREIAIKYKILNPNELLKKEDGKWYFHGLQVDEYDELMSIKDNNPYQIGSSEKVKNETEDIKETSIPTPKPKTHKKSKYRLRPPISGPIDPLA